MQEYFDRLKNDFGSLLNKKSIASLVVLAFVIISIPLGLSLLKQTLTYLSRAGGGPPIELLEGNCVVSKNDKTIKCNEIPLKLISPLGGPVVTPNPPQNLRVQDSICRDGKNVIVLKWDPVPDVIGYFLTRRIVGSEQAPFVNNVLASADTYEDKPDDYSISPGTRLTYTLVSGVGFQSAPSNTVETVTKNCSVEPSPSPSSSPSPPPNGLTASCRIYGMDKNTSIIGEQVRWQVVAEGGVRPYQISWSGNDSQLRQIGDSNLDMISVSFTTEGAKIPDVRVRDQSNLEKQLICPAVTVSQSVSQCTTTALSKTPQAINNKTIKWTYTYPFTTKIKRVVFPAVSGISLAVGDQNGFIKESAYGQPLDADLGEGSSVVTFQTIAQNACTSFNAPFKMYNNCGTEMPDLIGAGSASAYGSFCSTGSNNDSKSVASFKNPLIFPPQTLKNLSQKIANNFSVYAQDNTFKISGKICVRIDRTQYQNQGTCQSGDLPFTNRQVLLFEGSRVNIEPGSNLRDDQASFKLNTDSTGNYSFPNLENGAYRVTHRIPEGFERLTDDSQPIDVAGADKLWDFVLYTKYTIKGTVFIDKNKDGKVDGGDERQANETVILADDEKGEHIIATTKSDSQGEYKFENLAPSVGNNGYRVTHYVPDGFVRTTDDSHYPLRVSQDNPVAEALFGYTPKQDFTAFYRIADMETELEFAEWRRYSEEPLVTNFNISEENPGSKQIWVEFKTATGRTKKENISLTWLQPDPEPGSLSCSFDIARENVKVTVSGGRMGSSAGKIQADGKNLEILEWKDDLITALIKNPDIKPNEGKKFKIKVITKDGITILDGAPCEIDTSLIYLGARLFCREPGKFDQNDVKINLLDQDNKKIEETVTIDKDGVVRGLKTKLESGKKYVLSIKAPKSVRRNAVFTASGGTTIVTNPKNDTDSLRKDDFILPIGDIAPPVNADGKINTLDRAVLTGQWRIFGTDIKTLTGDFNRDTKVNSFDWACMRYDFNAEDEAIPSIAPPPAPPKPTGPDLTRKLLTYWNMNNATGSAVPDVKGANNGTAVGTTSVPGKISNARSLNGTSDYIQINDSANLAPNYQTVSAWVLPRTFDKISTDSASIYNRKTISDSEPEKSLGGINLAVSQGIGTNEGVFSCNVYVKDLGWRSTVAISLAKDQWNHLVCAYNGSTIRIYKNGNLASVYSISGVSPVNDPLSPSTQIGRNVSSNMFLDGLVDEIGVWSRGLQPVEIQKLYNNGLGEDPFGNAGN